MEKKTLRNILFIYFSLVIIKILIASLVKSPTIFADEYYYMRMARSFFNNHTFFIDNTFSTSYPPLYPILTSIAYIFKDMQLVYFFMKVINSLISSLMIVPIFLIAKEFFNEKKSVLIALLISVMPPFFIISFYILSENLFYTLFLSSVYFVYKAFKENKLRYDLLAGFLIGLTLLTRVIGAIVLVLVIFLMILLKNKISIKNKFISIIIPILMYIPWMFIANYHLKNTDIIRVTGYELTITNILQTKYITHALYWIPLNLTYIILSTGIIFFLAYIMFIKSKEYKNNSWHIFYLLASILLVLFLALSSIYNLAYTDPNNFLVGRPIERYFASLLPLIVIAGLIGIENNVIFNNNKLLKAIILISLLFVISAPLTLYTLFPANNPSLIYLGIASFLVELLTKYKIIVMIITLAILPLIVIKVYRLNMRVILTIFLIFFSLVSMLNVSFIVYNANTKWYSLDQTKLGLWLNEMDKGKSTILFDKRDIDRDFRWDSPNLNQRERSIGIIGFWLNNDIIIGDVVNDRDKVDFIISTEKLDLQIVNQGKSSESRNIYIYKADK